MFGMLRIASLLNLMRDQKTRIACMRYLAKRFNARSEWLLIRYKKELFLDKAYPSEEQEPQELDSTDWKNFYGRYCLDNPQQGSTGSTPQPFLRRKCRSRSTKRPKRNGRHPKTKAWRASFDGHSVTRRS